jgi:hypothetical protein
MMAVIESRNNADPSSTLKEREQHKKTGMEFLHGL